VFRELVEDPRLWHPRKGLEVVFGSIQQAFMEDHFRWLSELYRPGQTLIVSHLLDFTSRILRDLHADLRLCTVVPAPALLRSLDQPPRLTAWGIETKLPKRMLDFAYRQADRILDKLAAPAINRLRSQVGLPPVERIMHRWWASPDMSLALFPEWFSIPSHDHPAGLQCVGFPLADSGDLLDTAGEQLVDEALAPLAGRRPIVFAPGSAHARAQPFLEAAARSCQLLQLPGVLLSSVSSQFPTDLPSGVITANYLPFSQLLNRSLAIVHHGGVGTTSQALAAGIPQVVVPMAFDQFDNAARVTRLGCGSWLPMTRVSGHKLANHLRRALTNPQVSTQAQLMQQKMMTSRSSPTELADAILRHFAL